MDDVSPPNPVIFFLLENFPYPIVFVFGAVVGSFLNVLIYRLPLIMAQKELQRYKESQGEKVDGPTLDINGKSFCPRCNHYLAWWQNVPIFGFLYLGGRCAYCKVRISWRYFAVELLNACLWVALLYHIQPKDSLVLWFDFAFQALFVSVLVAMIFIDLDHFIAPDELNVAAAALGVGRDVVCLGLVWMLSRTANYGSTYWSQLSGQYLSFGAIPNALVGAVAYGLVLLAVSVAGFVYYAKPPWEPFGSAIRRYFTFADPPPPPADYVMPPEEAEEAELVEEGEPGEATRLGLAPGALALLSALVLFPAAGWFALLFFIIPLVAFLFISPVPGESPVQTIQRFFSVEDQAGLPDDALPVDSVSGNDTTRQLEAAMQEEADQFAREAETGQHGGMGMGDVKLAFGIGALLGPGLALLSLLFATFLGAVTGILLAATKGKTLRTGVPFVPFMAAGAIIALLWGNAVIGWYISISGLNKTDDPVPPPNTPAMVRPAEPRP
ncbi:MAG: hypothetical protein OHK0029_26170 [Armatimonadaceae bacterium]